LTDLSILNGYNWINIILQVLLVICVILIVLSVIGAYGIIAFIAMIGYSAPYQNRTGLEKLIPYIIWGILGLLLYGSYVSIRYTVSL
jgi:hypothetical protein